jgi:hypothetical protein
VRIAVPRFQTVIDAEPQDRRIAERLERLHEAAELSNDITAQGRPYTGPGLLVKAAGATGSAGVESVELAWPWEKYSLPAQATTGAFVASLVRYSNQSTARGPGIRVVCRAHNQGYQPDRHTQNACIRYTARQPIGRRTVVATADRWRQRPIHRARPTRELSIVVLEEAAS